MNYTIETVLLVEDDENDVLFLRRAFEKADTEISLQVATSGQQAVDYLAGNAEYGDRARFPIPRLIFLDLKLPGQTGMEVLKWIRQQPALCGVEVIVLSSSNQPVDVAEAYQLGANSYLMKPSAPDELVRVARAVNDYWFKLDQFPTVLGTVRADDAGVAA